MNPTLESIFSRYSCRAFTGEAPDGEQLALIAKAAVAAPSAVNAQPWRVIVIRDTELIKEMDADGMAQLAAMEDRSAHTRFMERGGTLFYNAPVMFMIPILPDTGLDAGILCENISLAAQSLGLGSLICGMARLPMGGARAAEFKRRMGFPDGYEFGIAVLIGHAEKTGAPHELDLSKISYV